MGRPLQTVQLFGVPHPEPKRRKRSSADVPTEAAEQRMVCQWLNAKRLRYFHVPNGEKRNAITGANLRGLGVKPGVPDLIITTTPPGKFGIAAVALEMKRRKGGSISVEQREWLDHLKSQGWATFVAHGADEAIAWLGGLYP
jgi:hypothetical protein